MATDSPVDAKLEYDVAWGGPTLINYIKKKKKAITASRRSRHREITPCLTIFYFLFFRGVSPESEKLMTPPTKTSGARRRREIKNRCETMLLPCSTMLAGSQSFSLRRVLLQHAIAPALTEHDFGSLLI